MNALSLRRASAADASAIARVYVRTWRAAYRGILPAFMLDNMNELRETLFWWTSLCEATSDAAAFVAVDPDVGVVGFLTCGPERRRGEGRRAEIHTLYILPAYQRMGIGTRLLAATGAWLIANQSPSMVVWVLAANSARSFYECLGGVAFSARTIRVGGRYVQEVAYVWSDLAAFNAATTGGSAEV